MKTTRSTPVAVKPLAGLLNLTDVRVRQLCEEGVIVKLERGRYVLWASIERVLIHKIRRRSQASASPNGLARLLWTVQKYYHGLNFIGYTP